MNGKRFNRHICKEKPTITRTIPTLTAAFLAATTLPAFAAADLSHAKDVFAYVMGDTVRDISYCEIVSGKTTRSILNIAQGVLVTLELSDSKTCTSRLSIKYHRSLHAAVTGTDQGIIRTMGSDLTDTEPAKLKALPLYNPSGLFVALDDDKSTYLLGSVAITDREGKI